MTLRVSSELYDDLHKKKLHLRILTPESFMDFTILITGRFFVEREYAAYGTIVLGVIALCYLLFVSNMSVLDHNLSYLH